VASWKRQPATPRNGLGLDGQRVWVSRSIGGRIWKAFGLKRTGRNLQDQQPRPSSSTRSATSWGCIWIPPEKALCCVVEKNPDPGPGPLGASAPMRDRDARTTHNDYTAPRITTAVAAGKWPRTSLRIYPRRAIAPPNQEVLDKMDHQDSPPIWTCT